jgi:hypothetical protein
MMRSVGARRWGGRPPRPGVPPRRRTPIEPYHPTQQCIMSYRQNVESFSEASCCLPHRLEGAQPLPRLFATKHVLHTSPWTPHSISIAC